MISLFVARHTSINVVDHLISSFKACFDFRILFDVKLGRTKCLAIIRNVIYPYFQNQLREDIGNSFFSLIIDESTGIGVVKNLEIVIKYYSENKRLVVTTFLNWLKLINVMQKVLSKLSKRNCWIRDYIYKHRNRHRKCDGRRKQWSLRKTKDGNTSNNINSLRLSFCTIGRF